MKHLFWRFAPAGLTLLAFALRIWQLGQRPPGWSDDELSNILVISQKVLQGDYSVYYADATGLEALYHVLAAGMLQLFGYNAIGIRLLSAILGTLTVPLTWTLGNLLFGRRVGLLAAALLAVSFWSLVYSRLNLRHISVLVAMLPAFIFFWQGLQLGRGKSRPGPFGWAGVALGLAFYTYFAGRGLPLILLAFLGGGLLLARPVIRPAFPAVLATFAIALLLAGPLVLTLRQLPGADARVAEVAVPLTEARKGNFGPLWENVITTLGMFQATGDPEFLYNVPGRAIFSPLVAALFWLGVGVVGWQGVQLLRRRPNPAGQLPYLFVGLWWLAGLAPAFLSVPAASLSHTLLAQPAVYLLLGVGVTGLADFLSRWPWLRLGLPVLVFGLVAGRDVPAYFQEWPGRGNTRYLYHANSPLVTDYLADHPELGDVALTGLLAGPWDREALRIDLAQAGLSDVRPRWYDPGRAIFWRLGGRPALLFTGYPRVEMVYQEQYTLLGQQVGDYQLARALPADLPPFEPVCFVNGLCLVGAGYEPGAGKLELAWEVSRPVTLPPLPIVSKPPPPGVYDGPRLWVFAQLVDGAGNFLVGNDGLWVDPLTLQTGDLFWQQHWLRPPAGSLPQTALVGLYDPLTGQRIGDDSGRDVISFSLEQLQR